MAVEMVEAEREEGERVAVVRAAAATVEEETGCGWAVAARAAEARAAAERAEAERAGW